MHIYSLFYHVIVCCRDALDTHGGTVTSCVAITVSAGLTYPQPPLLFIEQLDANSAIINSTRYSWSQRWPPNSIGAPDAEFLNPHRCHSQQRHTTYLIVSARIPRVTTNIMRQHSTSDLNPALATVETVIPAIIMSNSGVELRNLSMEAIDPHEQFTRFLIEHEPELLRFILVTVPNRTDARDILQECSVALWRRFSDYDPERPFVAWAYGFARMEVRRFLRKSQRRAQLTERAIDLLIQDQQQHQHESDERDHHLEHCLKTLAEHQRKLLTGYYHEGHSVNELSEQNGPTIEAIYKSLQRIRGALHRCIETRIRGAEI